MLIYALRNNASLRPDGTGKVYVGQTKFDTTETRWEGHCYESSRGGTARIHEAIREVGVLAFEIEILESGILSIDELCGREVFWIAALNAQDPEWGYNDSKGGDRPPDHTGRKRSEETIQRLKASHKNNPRDVTFGHLGHFHTEETKAFLSTFRKKLMEQMEIDARRELTSAGRAKIKELREQGMKVGGAGAGKDNFMYGKRHSDETKEKIAEAHRGKPGHTNKARTGMPHSEASKELMSQKAKERWAQRRS